MAEFNFQKIDQKWQNHWEKNGTFKADENSGKPKYYVLDMFPYPSGEGLHVGHPLGYIASDIFARYQRNRGYEVLHPMGFDAFGLPAEQYAIETGQHPAVTTEQNIKRYRDQLKMLGLSFDWSREVKTCDPNYYQWTQWIFLKFYNAWYNKSLDKAEPIAKLVEIFNQEGNVNVNAFCNEVPTFTAETWRLKNHDEKEQILLNYRLAYIADSEVNWCPALGTVLANDEVQNGFSLRGNHPVERRKMRQWFLRITAYADRLLADLDEIDWPDSIKEVQRNWIGRSEGAEILFPLQGQMDKGLMVFTTRPDTIFGVTYMVLAPEHEMAEALATEEYKDEVKDYIQSAMRKSELERKAESKEMSGVFTGSYVLHPFTGKLIPVWVADYVLVDYGTGAIMAVPGHDERDHKFAQTYDLSIVKVIEGDDESSDLGKKEGKLINSDFINGLEVPDAIEKIIQTVEAENIGVRKINYKLRDATFSRQRYWGEPFPVVYNNGVPLDLDKKELPVVLPEVESFKPAESGESPLARETDWINLPDGTKRETHTMPGYAGSSWYFLRYMDPMNNKELVSEEREAFWQNVDFYVGGSEHATGHLMYARFWQKFLYDLGCVSQKEPFKKMVNQGMIEGYSAFVYRVKGEHKFVSYNLRKNYDTIPMHVDVHLIRDNVLDVEAFRQWRKEYKDAEFLTEDGQYIVGREIEKMSKSKYNVINPDDVIDEYGCDTFRMYEMFLGPVEQSKPWQTEGIEGVYKFLKKFWRLFINYDQQLHITDEAPNEDELKVLHKAIKNIKTDVERFSLNTCVSHFMIAANELTKLNCHKKAVLEPLLILLSPFAPHMTEEIWEQLGYEPSISNAPCPEYNEDYLKEEVHQYPISINGKVRAKQEFPVDKSQAEIEQEVFEIPAVKKWTEGKAVKKIIYKPGKIINIVVN